MARPRASEDPFRAIADPTRRTIIELLASRPRTAGELASGFATCQSTVSEHLGILRRAGLVTCTEQAGRRTYRLAPSPLAEVAAWSARYAAPPPLPGQPLPRLAPTPPSSPRRYHIGTVSAAQTAQAGDAGPARLCPWFRDGEKR